MTQQMFDLGVVVSSYAVEHADGQVHLLLNFYIQLFAAKTADPKFQLVSDDVHGPFRFDTFLGLYFSTEKPFLVAFLNFYPRKENFLLYW